MIAITMTIQNPAGDMPAMSSSPVLPPEPPVGGVEGWLVGPGVVGGAVEGWAVGPSVTGVGASVESVGASDGEEVDSMGALEGEEEVVESVGALEGEEVLVELVGLFEGAKETSVGDVEGPLLGERVGKSVGPIADVGEMEGRGEGGTVGVREGTRVGAVVRGVGAYVSPAFVGKRVTGVGEVVI